MSVALSLHLVECPECEHEFYVQLPQTEIDNDHAVISKETDCVECDKSFNRNYEVEYTEESADIELTVEAINNE